MLSFRDAVGALMESSLYWQIPLQERLRIAKRILRGRPEVHDRQTPTLLEIMKNTPNQAGV
jgi:hypothetical protein